MFIILLIVSILGGLRGTYTAINSSTNLNDLLTPSKRYSWVTDAPVNAPFTYGLMNIIELFPGAVFLQIVTYQGKNAPKISYRMKEYGEWGLWKEISTDVPTFYKNYNDLASLQTALGVNTKLRNKGNISVAAGATETMDIGAYCGFVFVVNQDIGHISLIATSYNHSTEIAHESSGGSFTASVVNKTLSITNNSAGTQSYSISVLV